MDSFTIGSQPFKALQGKKAPAFKVPTEQLIKVIQGGRGLIQNTIQADRFEPLRSPKANGQPDFDQDFTLNPTGFIKNIRAKKSQDPNKGINVKEAGLTSYLLLRSAHENSGATHPPDGCPTCTQLTEMAGAIGEIFKGVDINSNNINSTFKAPVDPEDGEALAGALSSASELTPTDVKWLAGLDGDPTTISNEDIAKARELNTQASVAQFATQLDKKGAALQTDGDSERNVNLAVLQFFRRLGLGNPFEDSAKTEKK